MANLNPLCDICGEARATISDGTIGALICQNSACFEKAWDRAYSTACDWCRRPLNETAPIDCVNPEHRKAANPCGHSITQRGCGGCDPSAIEFVIDHAGVRWTLESALSALDRVAVIADEMGSATTYDQWDELCVRLRAELGNGQAAD